LLLKNLKFFRLLIIILIIIAIAKSAVEKWYSENRYYNFERGSDEDGGFTRAGRFTQMVWNDSKFAGYGFSVTKKKGWFTKIVVVNYDPRGNFFGRSLANVFPKKN
jgi:hypothetical protein